MQKHGWQILRSIIIAAMALAVVPLVAAPGCPSPGSNGGLTITITGSDNGGYTGGSASGSSTNNSDYGLDANGDSTYYSGKTVAWGDLHSHTTYSYDALDKNTCTATPYDALGTAQYSSDLDFVSITDHAENGAPGQYTQQKWDDTLAQILQFQSDPYLVPSLLKPVTTFRQTGFDPVTNPMVIFPAFEYTKTKLNRNPAQPGDDLPPGNGHKNIMCYDTTTVPPRGVGYDYTLSADLKDANGNVVLAKDTTLSTPTRLWTYLNNTAAAGHYMCIPHHPAKTQDKDDDRVDVRTDWSETYVDAAVQPLVEVYSRHGTSEMTANADNDDLEHVNVFDQMCSIEAALDLWLANKNAGYKLGFVGGTDTHDANPGAVDEAALKVDGVTPANIDNRLGSSTGGRYTGGLTAVWVTDKTSRSEIWNGLKNKGCYATSGARIPLQFTLKVGNMTKGMGETLTHSLHYSQTSVSVYLYVKATGENGNPITRIQIFKVDGNGKTVYDTDLDTNMGFTAGNVATAKVQEQLRTDYAYYRVKVWQQKASNPLASYQNINYERAWSSPIWVQYAASESITDPLEEGL